MVPKDAVMLKVITYRGNQVMGKQIDMPIAELKIRANKSRKEDKKEYPPLINNRGIHKAF
jgi:hypothetical protein